MHDATHAATVHSIAVKSECGQYRYYLKRVWNPGIEVGAFLCANPSKADHLLSDDTVFKCGNLAVQWGWGGFYILNLYPHYSTDPALVERTAETDQRNAHYVALVATEVKTLVLACGNGHKRQMNALIAGVPKEKLFCLRKNAGGGFLHPSRIKPEDFAHPVRAF
jgi:hypothetical protein